jgi:hypothetical protein
LNKCYGTESTAIGIALDLTRVCHFSRPPILTVQLRKRGDAHVARFLPKDGDKDKAAAELEQQVGVVTSLLHAVSSGSASFSAALRACMSTVM